MKKIGSSQIVPLSGHPSELLSEPPCLLYLYPFSLDIGICFGYPTVEMEVYTHLQSLEMFDLKSTLPSFSEKISVSLLSVVGLSFLNFLEKDLSILGGHELDSLFPQ